MLEETLALVVVVIVVVVVVIVVVGQTFGSISIQFQAKRWPPTVCAPLNYARHRRLLPVNSDFSGIFA